jgi:hypothetical protein
MLHALEGSLSELQVSGDEKPKPPSKRKFA